MEYTPGHGGGGGSDDVWQGPWRPAAADDSRTSAGDSVEARRNEGLRINPNPLTCLDPDEAADQKPGNATSEAALLPCRAAATQLVQSIWCRHAQIFFPRLSSSWIFSQRLAARIFFGASATGCRWIQSGLLPAWIFLKSSRSIKSLLLSSTWKVILQFFSFQ